MRHTNRFSAIARVVGALTAAALLALVAAPDAQAQATDFGSIVTGPTGAPTVGGLFQVTFQFKVLSDDTNGVIVTGFAPADVTVSDSKGAVQSISRAATTNIYRVNIKANSNVGTGDSAESLTATLAANAVSYTASGTTYSNTSAQTVTVNVDQKKPTVTLTPQTLEGVTEADRLVNGKFRVQFQFNEAVTGFTLSDISVANGAKSNFVTTEAGRTYTVDVMPNSSFNGDLKVTVPSGSVTDSVGNMIEKTETTVKVDQKRPTVTISAPSQWGDEAFAATVTFNEAVNGFTAEDVTVKETDTDADPDAVTNGSASITSGADGSKVFVISIDPASTTDTLTIAIAENAAFDRSGVGSDANANGNGNTAATTKTVTIDAARPTVTSTTITLDSNNNVDLSATETTTFTVGITFNEEVTGFQQGGGDISVTNGTVTLAGNLPGTTFTATVTPTANYEGDMTITIPANAAYSNANSAKGNPRYTRTVTISQGAPTPTIAVSKARTNSSVTATVTFPEPVTGFEKNSTSPETGDLVIAYTGTGSLTSAMISDYTVTGTSTYKNVTYATTYAVTVTLPDAAVDDNTIVFHVASGAAKDKVGNDNADTSTAAAARTATVDKTAPTLTISAPGAATSAFEATFTFNEHIKEGSFTASDITVTNGTVGTVTGANSTGEGAQSSTWKSTITPTSGFNGTLTINVAANVTTDIAGNGNKVYDRVPDDTEEPIDQTTLGVQPWNVTIDQNAPTVTLTPESTQENGAFSVTMVFSESVTGLAADDIEVPIIDNGRADNTETTDVDESKTAQATVSAVAGGGTNWTATITPRAAVDSDDDSTPNVDESKAFNGNLTIKVKANAVIDSSGNGNTASLTKTVNINTVKPTLTIATKDTRGAGKDFNGPFTATFTFSKSVTGFSKDDITVTGGGADVATSTVAGSGTTYTATITPTPDDPDTTDNNESFQGAMTISVAVDRVEDAHGNGNAVYDSDATQDGAQTYSVNIDTTKPVPVITLVNPNSLTSFGHAEDLTFNVSFTNGSGGSNEDVTGLATGDFTFKHMRVSKVVNNNNTADNATDDTTTYVDGLKESGSLTDLFAEASGGGTATSVKTVPVTDAADTYTAVIDPSSFSPDATPATIDFIPSLPGRDTDPPASSKDTITVDARRKLRIYFPVNKVTDKAGNSNAILPDQDSDTTGDQNYVQVQLDPGIPTIAITTNLTRTAFSGNQLSNGQPFMVYFNSSQSLGVFGTEDVTLNVGSDSASKSDFSGSGSSYSMKITPVLRVDTGDNQTAGFTGDLTISIASNINNLGNFAASKTIRVDQDTPKITAFTGIYKENEDGTVASETSSGRFDGSAFYVKLTTDEEVENLSNANFNIYEVGDTAKTSVGSATAFKGSDPASDGADQTWDVKILPSSTFSGNMAIEVKKGAGTDRAGLAVELGDGLTTLGGTADSPTIVIDQVSPVPLITFTTFSHGDRTTNNEATGPRIRHNVIPASQSTFEVKIRHKDGSRTKTNGDPIFEQVNAQYNNASNFTTADIVVSPKGAGVVTSVTGEGSGANNVWTATITPTADTDPDTEGNQPWEGTITLSIAANKFKDIVGHDNLASNSFTAVIDKTPPKLKSISQSAAVAPDLAFDLEFEYSETVTVTDQDDPADGIQDELNAALAVAGFNGPFTAPTAWNAKTIDDGHYTITVTRVAGSQTKFKAAITLVGTQVTESNVAVYAAASAVQDLAGQNNAVSYNTDDHDATANLAFKSAINRTSPVVVISSETPYDTVNPTQYGFRFLFSTSITGFEESDFQVTNGAVVSGSLTQSYTAGSTTRTAQTGRYFARFTATGAGDLIIRLPAGAVTDAAKNPSFAVEHRLDLGRPTATIHVVKLESGSWVEDTSPSLKDDFHIEVRFNENVKFANINDTTTGENDEDLPIAVNGGIETADAEDADLDNLRDWLNEDGAKVGSGVASPRDVTVGRTYRTQIEPSEFVGGKADFALTIGLGANEITDTSSAENGNQFAQKTVQIDQTPPKVVITPTEIGNSSAANITVTFTYDEPVNGFTESDITSVTGGTLTANSLVRKLKDGTVVTDTTKPAEVHTVIISTSSGVTEVSFALAAGVVTDVAGNASLAYDSDPETTGNQPHKISVDTVRPTPLINGPAGSGDKYGAGPFLISITFTDAPTANPLVGEAVTGFTLSDLTITGGTASNFVADQTASVKGSIYQVQINPTSPTTGSKVTVALPENAATDGAGNKSKAYDKNATEDGNQPYEATFDSTLPYVSSITAPVAAKTDFSITVNFNEAVSGFAAADMQITGGKVKDNVVTTITSSSYSMTIVPNPAVSDDPDTTDVDETASAFEGNLGIAVVSNAATSVANPSKNTVASATKFVRIDLTPPTVTSFVLNNGQPLGVGVFSFPVSITFNEDILTSTWAAGDLTVTGGSVTSVGTSGNRTVTAMVNTTNQNATVSLGSNKVTDLVGNGNVAHAGGSVAIGSGTGTDKPTVSIIVVDGSYTRNATPFQIQITFNKAVTGFAVGDLSVTRGTAGTFSALSGQTYTAVITPAATSQNPNVQIQVPANVATSVVGNHPNVASGTTTVSISTSSRTVSVTSSAQAPVPSNATFDVNISFSQGTSGFGMGDITVLNGYVASLTHVSLSQNWVAKIMPTGPEVSVYLVQNVVTGGNAPSNIFTIRSSATSTVPATLQVSLTAPPAVKAGASTVNIQFTRDGAGVPLMTNTFVIGDLSVTPASVVLSDLTPHPSDPGRYMVTATPPADFEGSVTVSIAADAVTDLRGNKNPAASVTTQVDSTPPTVAIAGPAGPANGAVDATITFSEPVTGFEAEDLTVSGGTAGDIAGSGAVYTVTVTPEADYNGELTVDVAANAAADVAGNMSTAAEQYAVTIDQTPPTVTVTGPEGPIREDAEQITITFSEDVGDSFTLADIAVENGTASDLTPDADTKGLYTAMVQADEGFEGMLTVDIAAGAATDLAANENTAAEQYSVEVVLDTTFTISLSRGLNLIHVPVKDETLAKVSDLYTALGGSSDVAYILSYVPADESFAAYIGIPGSSGDTALSDQSAVIVSMRSAKDVSFTGGLLSDTVSLTAGINLIGVPRDGAVSLASEVAPGAAAVLVLTSDALGNAQFSLVIPNTPTDVAASGGQGYIVVAAADDSITYTGEAWKDPEVEDGSSPTTIASADAVKYDPTSTPILLIEGLFAREDTLEPINGLSVSIKNLRTGESVVDTAGLTAGSGRFVKPMLALRGGSYEAGDAFEVSVVDPSGTFGGLTPVRAIVSKDEIAGGRIDIGRQLLSAVPDRTALLPNYPNPFNPETWIPFDLSKSSQVTVTVYNAAGQTVRVLELGQLPAGQYRSRSKAAYWDGRNALGERVSSGLYFYRIEAGSFSALRRMVILK